MPSFFKSLKGKGPDYIGGDNSSGSGGGTEQYHSSGNQYGDGGIYHEGEGKKKNRFFGGGGGGRSEQYDPPSGPPPGHGEYQPPAGPPPGHGDYQPPSGPPPGHRDGRGGGDYAPPSGPPPGHSGSNKAVNNPPPYHDWENAVPDTSTLPPPPTIRHEFSSNNSAEEDAIMAHKWVEMCPLYTPTDPPPAAYSAAQNNDINLVKPREMTGELKKVKKGVWKGKTKASRDAILLSNLPLYFASKDSPLQTEVPKTIYYEVRMLGIKNAESGLAMGFCAQPYPSWRLPGHERASLGVHGDDGRRFVNDSYGGIDFTGPFKVNDVLGIGMTFSMGGNGAGINVEVFFTRNGRKVGGWNLFEQRDQSAGSVEGLEGRWDLYGAIGVFGDLEFEVAFAQEAWSYQPR